MQTDPAMEWRRLTEEYRAMGDEELRNLAADFDDLTDNAKQALRQEMQSRGLGDPASANTASPPATPRPPVTNEPTQRPRSGPTVPDPAFLPEDSVFGLGRGPKIVPDDPDGGSEDDAADPHDYTWKTVLCECETNDEAQHLANALRNAGLDSWVQDSREFGRRYARVLVAADQLDRAQAIAAQPIPQEIVDDSKEEIPEFIEPKCPRCGSDDVVLESVDPENHWRCEQCDAEWSDQAEVAGDEPAKPVDRPT
jgi:hypothetical protein